MKLSFKKFIPGIAWFFVVLVLMCFPGKEIPNVSWLEGINLDKVLHITVFGLLTVLFCWPFHKSSFNKKERLQYFIRIAIATSIWGLTTELIQRYLIPGRYFDVLDWIADSIGALLAFWFCSRKFT